MKVVMSTENLKKQLEWDVYFLKIAKEVSNHSKCTSRKIGAVVVRERSIVSTGYNGPAKGVKHCNERTIAFYEGIQKGKLNLPEGSYPTTCPRRYFDFKSGQGLHLCQAGHAERNALIQAAKNGIATNGATLYCYCGQVCKDCAIEIINAGIKELVYLEGTPYDEYSDVILKESGILVRKVDGTLL